MTKIRLDNVNVDIYKGEDGKVQNITIWGTEFRKAKEEILGLASMGRGKHDAKYNTIDYELNAEDRYSIKININFAMERELR